MDVKFKKRLTKILDDNFEYRIGLRKVILSYLNQEGATPREVINITRYIANCYGGVYSNNYSNSEKINQFPEWKKPILKAHLKEIENGDISYLILCGAAVQYEFDKDPRKMSEKRKDPKYFPKVK